MIVIRNQGKRAPNTLVIRTEKDMSHRILISPEKVYLFQASKLN
jgi:hypothetical protein